jgi:hypothetical protein
MTEDDAMDQRLRRWGADARAAAPPVSIPDVTSARWSRHIAWPALAAALVAIALIATAVGITAARSNKQASNAGHTAPTAVTPATAPEGMRAVVFHGLAVNVPFAWSTGKAHCGVPTENTVLLDGPTEACGVGELPAVSSVSFKQFTPGSVPTPPRACCALDGSTTETPAPQGQPITVGDAPATRYRSEPSPDEPFFTDTITVESHQAAIIVRSPDAMTINGIIASLRLEQADTNGCVSYTEQANFSPPGTASPGAPSGTASPGELEGSVPPLIPDNPASLTVCRYFGGWIEQSNVLNEDEAANLVALINDAPEGTSTSDSAIGACRSPSRTQPVAPAATEGFTLTAAYPDQETVVVAAQISCAPFGLLNGDSTRQMTSDIASALVSAAGASKGWPMNFYPNP